MKTSSDKVMHKALLLALFVLGFIFAGYSQHVQGVYVYPEKNQSKSQMNSDENSCYSWAQNEVSVNNSGQEHHQKHKALKGAGIGGAAGAIIGGGKGAIIGGGAGAYAGHRKSKNDKEEVSGTASNDFRRAYASCLRAKGYSVE